MIAKSNHTDKGRCAYDDGSVGESKDQLRRLLVASADGPEVWTEERADERKLEKVESRQLD